MKLLHAVVRSCGDCPFMQVVEDAFTIEGGETMHQGWFCMHKARKGYVLTLKDVEFSTGFNNHLTEQHGRPFPPDCPLPDVGGGVGQDWHTKPRFTARCKRYAGA